MKNIWVHQSQGVTHIKHVVNFGVSLVFFKLHIPPLLYTLQTWNYHVVYFVILTSFVVCLMKHLP